MSTFVIRGFGELREGKIPNAFILESAPGACQARSGARRAALLRRPRVQLLRLCGSLGGVKTSMTRPADDHAVRILLSLYLVEAASLLILVGIYKARVYDWTLLPTKAGAVLLAGAIGLIASAWLLVRRILACGGSRGRALALGLTTNLITALIAFLLLETTVRIAARRTPQGIVVGSVALQATWPELVARSREVLAAVTPWGTWDASYFVYDRELGWTVGPNRRSPDGMYFSSVEGVRSGGPDMRFAHPSARHRVALIGDSNAFSFEVPFRDSWGYHLQQLLGADVQVLNFGVDGYGIDQIYLRYLRDVRPWKPRVVVIGISAHDFQRTMAVYPFVSFEWPGYLVKPRFTIVKDELRLLNVPLPAPEQILGARRIGELPFVDYDLGYGTTDWIWRFDRSPLIVRFLTSAFPRWPMEDPRVSEEATQALNSRLFTRMLESIAEAGAVPLVVFMSHRSPVPQTLSLSRTPFLDTAGCLSEVPANRTRVPSGNHYTGLANQAIARCTTPAVKAGLRRPAPARRRAPASRPSRTGSPN